MNDFEKRWAVTMVRASALAVVLALLVAALIDATR